MAQKIFFGNYKGGVGKTTTVYEIGAILSEKLGKRVLLIDLDPQCSLSKICGKKSENKEEIEIDETLNFVLELYSEYINKATRIEILEGNIKVDYSNTRKCIRNIKDNLDYIPTVLNIKNSRLNDIAERMSRNKKNILSIPKLIEDLEGDDNKYDYILFDCPPTSNIITQGVFLYSDYYLIPTIADEISVDGVSDYIIEIDGTYLKYTYSDEIGGIVLKKYFGDKPNLIGVLITLFKALGPRNPDDFLPLKNLNKSIDSIGIKTLVSKTTFSMKNNKNIFKKVVPHKDNRSDPNNYGVPITVSEGEIHDEYLEVAKNIVEVLKVDYE